MAFGDENVGPPSGERGRGWNPSAVAHAAVVGLHPEVPFEEETPFPPEVPRFEGGRLLAGTAAACARLG